MGIDDRIAKGIIKGALGLIGSLLLCYFLYKIQIVFIYFGIAAVIAIIGRPLILFLNGKLRFSNTVAALITMLLFLVLIIFIFLWFIPLISQQADNFSLLNREEFKEYLQTQIYQVTKYFEKYGISLSNSLLSPENLMDKLSYLLPNFLNRVLEIISSLFIGVLSVLFVSFFLLKDRMFIKKMLCSFVPDREEKHLENVLDKINNLLSRYFIGLIIQFFIMFTIYVIILFSFGIDSPLIIAFFCALLNIIPFIGPLIGGILMIFLTVSHFIGQGLDFMPGVLFHTGYVLLAYLCAQLIDNFITQPIIFSNSVKSHPLEVFLVIVVGGTLFGVVGVIFALPAYTAVRVILKEFFGHFKWVQSITKNI